LRKPQLAHSSNNQDALPTSALLSSAADLPAYKTTVARKFIPATLAILLQFAAVLCVLALAYLLQWVAVVYLQRAFSLPLLFFVLLQAAISAVFAVWARMASWWRWIHAGFPLAIWLMAQLQLPSECYLLGFLVSLALFWTTFRSQVPFFPSRPAVWQQVGQLLPASKLRIVDIGSGLGDLSMHLSLLRSDCSIEGIEIAPLPWLLSYVRARLRRSTAKFKFGDYHALDFGAYDVIFAYLSPAVMSDLRQKAQLEMRPGSMLISYEFDIPGVVATELVSTGFKRPPLFVWRLPMH